MAKTVSLKAQGRAGIGRTEVKRLRASGQVPGVLYAKGKSSAIALNAQELDGILHHATSTNLLVDLEFSHDNKTDKKLALLQEVQFHPLKDFILHVDLHEIAQNEKLHTEVPVITTGEPAGVKLGGIFETMLRSLRVECLPKDLPSAITVDVSGMQIGQSLHVADIQAPEGVTFMNPKDLTVFIVVEPKVEEEKPVVAAEVQQPEVIKEKKTEEGAAAPAESKDKAKK